MKKWLVTSIFLLSSTVNASIISTPEFGGAYSIRFGDPIGQSFVAIESTLDYVAFNYRVFNASGTDVPMTLSIYEGEGSSGALLAEEVFDLSGVSLFNHGGNVSTLNLRAAQISRQQDLRFLLN